MPSFRTRLLETIRSGYPESFEGLDPSKALGEDVFDRPKPHPNAVLNLFVQQKLTSALPMAYYMAARGGGGVGLVDGRSTCVHRAQRFSGQTLVDIIVTEIRFLYVVPLYIGLSSDALSLL